MAYNSYFPAGYQQPYYQPMQPMTQNQMPQNNGGIIWVQGEAGAKSYLVAPNTTVQLWDSENQTIYLKSADASGMPSIKVIDYTIRDAAEKNATPLQNSEQYVTIESMKEIEKRLSERIKRLEEDIQGE